LLPPTIPSLSDEDKGSLDGSLKHTKLSKFLWVRIPISMAKGRTKNLVTNKPSKLFAVAIPARVAPQQITIVGIYTDNLNFTRK